MADWQDITSTDYWTTIFGTWGGSTWSSGEFAGYQFVSLTPAAWASGYAAGIIRVTYSLSALELTVVGSLGSAVEVINSGGEVDVSALGDLTAFQFGGTATPFTVSKIEIYGDAIGSGDEEEEMPGIARMFARNYSDTDVNYIWDWEYDHLQDGFSSGNDEVTMRCMRLYEMEVVSGDVKTGMLLFTDSTSVGRQTGTVIDSTEYLFDRDLGITTDVIDADDNVLFIFEKNPTDLSGGTDESDFPPYLRKYIEYAVLERAYAVDNDGNIASLRDYWAMRKTVGLKAIKQFMKLRKADRDYRMTTKGTPGFRTRREPRLPDAYPASVR